MKRKLSPSVSSRENATSSEDFKTFQPDPSYRHRSIDVIDRLDAAIHTIQEMGIDVRKEWLVAGVSGLCRIGNRHLLVLDQSLSPVEQIDVVQSALLSLERLPITTQT